MNIPNKPAALVALDETIANRWQEILAQPLALNFLNSAAAGDPRLYAMYLTQVYQYTWHTARNQALVGVNPANTNVHYQKYCFEHALEETGHELMALHDLRALGVPLQDPQRELPPPFPATELLIAYLYWVSAQGNPVQRLGYSYWAEKSYDYVRPFVETMQGRMKLKHSQMTFFHNHATIDEKHAREVEEILIKVCKTPADWRAVQRVAETTLRLTADILTTVVEEYFKLVENSSDVFALLNSLKREIAT
jgi:hypothetical protein